MADETNITGKILARIPMGRSIALEKRASNDAQSACWVTVSGPERSPGSKFWESEESTRRRGARAHVEYEKGHGGAGNTNARGARRSRFAGQWLAWRNRAFGRVVVFVAMLGATFRFARLVHRESEQAGLCTHKAHSTRRRAGARSSVESAWSCARRRREDCDGGGESPHEASARSGRGCAGRRAARRGAVAVIRARSQHVWRARAREWRAGVHAGGGCPSRAAAARAVELPNGGRLQQGRGGAGTNGGELLTSSSYQLNWY